MDHYFCVAIYKLNWCLAWGSHFFHFEFLYLSFNFAIFFNFVVIYIYIEPLFIFIFFTTSFLDDSYFNYILALIKFINILVKKVVVDICLYICIFIIYYIFLYGLN